MAAMMAKTMMAAGRSHQLFLPKFATPRTCITKVRIALSRRRDTSTQKGASLKLVLLRTQVRARQILLLVSLFLDVNLKRSLTLRIAPSVRCAEWQDGGNPEDATLCAEHPDLKHRGESVPQKLQKWVGTFARSTSKGLPTTAEAVSRGSGVQALEQVAAQTLQLQEQSLEEVKVGHAREGGEGSQVRARLGTPRKQSPNLTT